MKIIKLLVSVVFVSTISLFASAATFFDTRVIGISDVLGEGVTRFDIKAVNIDDSQEIDNWKIRFYCDENMKLIFSPLTESVCGRAIRLDALNKDSFFFSFENQNEVTKKFSVKLKAYDKNGNWLHSEKESFTWR
jgi:hypothetical protein